MLIFNYTLQRYSPIYSARVNYKTIYKYIYMRTIIVIEIIMLSDTYHINDT